ncbi:MAG: hypothetical protein JWR08_1626 [Enterovirga sp.]|jgi:hypothetical protein|nr:hypothetical protein [Enterovirga sp.]
MIIRLDERRTIHVEDRLDFKRFKLVVAGEPSGLDAAASAVGDLASFETAEKAWVSADRLKALVPDRTPEWDAGFARMIESARPYGWIKDDPVRIGAHVEWSDAPAAASP